MEQKERDLLIHDRWDSIGREPFPSLNFVSDIDLERLVRWICWIIKRRKRISKNVERQYDRWSTFFIFIDQWRGFLGHRTNEWRNGQSQTIERETRWDFEEDRRRDQCLEISGRHRHWHGQRVKTDHRVSSLYFVVDWKKSNKKSPRNWRKPRNWIWTMLKRRKN